MINFVPNISINKNPAKFPLLGFIAGHFSKNYTCQKEAPTNSNCRYTSFLALRVAKLS